MALGKGLIVEYDVFLRGYASTLFDDAGLQCLQAASADQALHILEGRSDVRVVMSDYFAPGSINAAQLARFILERWPNIGIIITAGTVVIATDLPEGVAFVPKPWRDAEVIGLIRALSGGR